MSAAIDTLSAEETALLKQMEQEDAALGPIPEPVEPAAAEVPEPAAEAKEPPKEQPKLVDQRALHEERERRKRLETELRTEREARTRLDERLTLLTQAAQAAVDAPAARVAEPPPAFDADPKAFIERNFQTIRQELAEARQQIQQAAEAASRTAQAQQAAQGLDDLQQWGRSQESEFGQATPDYAQAVQYLRDTREKVIRASGMDDPVQIQRAIAADVRAVAQRARETGANFGAMLYGIAEAHGYRKTTAAPVAAPVAAAAPAATQRPPANAAERLIRGQEMATTLGSTGAAPAGEPAAAVIAGMSDEAFASLYAKVKKNGAGAMKQLFGG